MKTKIDKSKKQGLKGVKPANQKRSIELQDKFVRAGQEMLLNMRLADIRIPDLAEKAGSSIGGFYSRFEDREVFFQFLQAAMLEDHMNIESALTTENLAKLSDVEVIEFVTATTIKIFSPPWRGVLRESYATIAEGEDKWAPMRKRGKKVADIVVALFNDRFNGRSNGPKEDTILFAMQMLNSALINDLMNPKLRFSIGDNRFEKHLSQMLFRFLELETE